MKYDRVTLETVMTRIHDGPLAFDTETDGKYGEIRLGQFYQRGWEHVLLVDEPNPTVLNLWLAKLDNTIIMQNAGYDVTTIQRRSNLPYIPNEFDDTLLMARLCWPALSSYSLDDLFLQLYGTCPYTEKGLNKKDLQKSAWKMGKPLTPEQYMYAATDVWHLLDLYDAVIPAKEDFCYQLDKLALRMAWDWQRNGMLVDQDRVAQKLAANIKRIDEIALPINANSYKQVRPYIDSDQSDGLGLTTLKLKGNEKAAAVLETRKLLKENTFLRKYITDDGRIYGSFGPYARSGRFTCADDNLQQLPRSTKDCFGTDRYTLYSDFSQLELRSIAAITGDRRLCQTYYEGGDVHNLVSDMCKMPRQNAKTINFNALYGGGAGMMH